MANRKPAKDNQQFTPVIEDYERRKAVERDIALGKVRQRDIQAELERDKVTIDAGDYWNSQEAFFSQFKTQNGEK